ncbi:O-Antigen ligase [Rubripirellula obstinata]|uniref:O-Antigen ligase n=1 Tax=Rubripirellula obstinata TaxID=406547 RepID=A0A5B1CGI3_9BACT|nr:O-antigen ligase family protein [Rubripirellula obstinata]KAA1259292.1 O-Antigen ligase [Rubripirellula obstinata]
MELLILLFVAAAAMWMIPVIHRGRVIPVTMMMLITGTVFGPFFFAIDGPIQFSLDRLLWLGIIGMVVVGWRLGNIKFPKPGRIDWLMAGLSAFLLFSALRGGDGPGVIESSPTARWLFYIFMPLGTYAVARTIRLNVSDMRWVFGSILGLGLYLAITGIFEIKEMHWAVFPKHISNPEVWEFYGRARGPLLNPIANGFLMGLALMVAVVEFFRSGVRQRKLFFGIAAFILLFGVYATLTRSCWMGAIGAIGLVAMIHSPRWVRVLGLASVVLLAGAMAMGLKDQFMEIKRDKALSAAEAAKSVELRPLLAIVAYEMFKDKPIAGHGFGHYFENNGPYHDNREYDLPLEKVRVYVQHNTFLSILVDGGLIGILMFSLPLLVFFVVGWQLARRPQSSPDARYLGILMISAIVIYVANAMFHDLIVIPMVQMFLMFIAGLAINVHGQGITAERIQPRRQAASQRDHRVVAAT